MRVAARKKQRRKAKRKPRPQTLEQWLIADGQNRAISLSIEHISLMFEIPQPTVRKWIMDGVFPKGYRVGRGLRWNGAVVEEWLRQQKRGTRRLPKIP